MNRSIILFTAFLCLIVGSTLLVSCNKEDDDKRLEINDYGYISQITISDDVVRMYSDISATFEYPDGTTRNVKPIANEIIDRYVSKEYGNVLVSIEGNLRTDVVDGEKPYRIEFHHLCKCGAVVLFNDFESTLKGSVLNDKYPKLSSFSGTKHSFVFIKK